MTNGTNERPIGTAAEEHALALEFHAEFEGHVLEAASPTETTDERWTPLQHGHHIAISHLAAAKAITRLAGRGSRRGRPPDTERVSLLERFVFPYTPFTPQG